ncbi:MAG: toll/interleukin-1 receptor domain-containing protein [Candidatus Omnitrophica bacterium]|nr:toll/interleukin-1 receptor domain-containing protein [Candidatus Omnitrophota bacterium]
MAYKIFISYSTKDKDIAGELKRSFEDYDVIECFIAHDDIVHGSEWEKEILDKLQVARYFMPLQTDNLTQSYWCQQESGIAYAKGIKIIPLIPDDGGTEPVGFYAKYQGFKIKVNDLRMSVKLWLIKEGIIQQDNSEELEKRMIIFSSSDSWSEAAENTRSLLELEECFVLGDVLRILDIAISNDQIWCSYAAKPILKKLFVKYATHIPREKIEKFL